MSDKQETRADIIAEMRGNEFDDPHLDRDGIIGARRLARGWADRLEAAHERELAAGGDAAVHLEDGLRAIMALTEPSAHALDLLGTVHRTAKECLRQTGETPKMQDDAVDKNLSERMRRFNEVCKASLGGLQTFKEGASDAE